MFKTLWKILWISALGSIAFAIIVATLVAIFVPKEELDKARQEKEASDATEPPAIEPVPTPIQYKTVDWTQTPEEQGLKIGDWIVARGHPDALISAMRQFKGNLSELGNIDPISGDYHFETLPTDNVQVFELSYIESGSVGVIPPKSPLPPNIKIRSIVVFNIPDSTKHPAIKQFNLLRLHRLDAITDIIIGGQIERIGSPEEKDGHPRHVLYVEVQGGTFQLTASPEELTRTMEEAKANAVSIKQNFEQLKSQFAGWGFQHWNTMEYVQSKMHNPKSFEHVKTTFTSHKEEGYRIINMRYRGTNVLGAVVTNTIRVKVDLNGNIISVESHQ